MARPGGRRALSGRCAGNDGLDLRCGDGSFTAPLARILRRRAYALDVDPALVDQARAEAGRQGASVLEWFTADVRQLAEPVPEPLDVVLVANTFHGVPDKPGFVGAVAEVLKPGGLFAVVNWHPRPRERATALGEPRGPKTETGMSPDAVRAVAEPAGFKPSRLVELPPHRCGSVLERGA